jgi:hypothetical protein
VLHSYNPCALEAKAGRSQVPGQPGLQSEVLSQKQQKAYRPNSYAEALASNLLIFANRVFKEVIKIK